MTWEELFKNLKIILEKELRQKIHQDMVFDSEYLDREFFSYKFRILNFFFGKNPLVYFNRFYGWEHHKEFPIPTLVNDDPKVKKCVQKWATQHDINLNFNFG